MKRIFALLLAVSMLLVGCGSKLPKVSGEYSNLGMVGPLDELTNVLEESGLSNQQISTLRAWIRDFSGLAMNMELVGDYQPLPKEGPDYSAMKMDDTAETYAYQQWLNCRLVAYHLMKDVMTTGGLGDDRDTWLMFDIETIDNVPQLRLSAQERADFITVFNQIFVSGDVKSHGQQIQQAWKDREIEIFGDNLSLVCVYLHDPDSDVRYVGHAGVLMQREEGLMFFEKYSPMAPFQTSKFKNQEQLKNYLLSRPDFYGDERELAPIITINGEVI